MAVDFALDSWWFLIESLLVVPCVLGILAEVNSWPAGPLSSLASVSPIRNRSIHQ
jgi:hypothetical protein